MSYGSTALSAIVGRARAAKRLNTLTCTGRGWLSPGTGSLRGLRYHPGRDSASLVCGRRRFSAPVPWAVESVLRGPSRGLGGHLLGDKVTPEVAAMRETVVGGALFSPFPFHSVYSVEDHKKHVDWVKAMDPRVDSFQVKVSTPTQYCNMVAVGVTMQVPTLST